MIYLPFFIIIGYVIGSASPGYFFGRTVKHIDIRKFGNHNTGASNTYHVVGPIYGVATGIFDLLKAPTAYYLSLSWINPNLAIIVGLAAVLGHIFPFYLGFRGGKGVASLNGLFLFSLIFSSAIYSLILFVGMLTYYLRFVRPVKISVRHWLKLLSIILPLSLIWLGNSPIIWAVSSLLLASFIFDLARLLIPVLNKRYLEESKFSKDKEKLFSGYTAFLFSSFVIIALFPKEIAILSLIFFALGDVFAPFSKNISYLPQIRLIGGKTLAGFIVVFAISFFAGWFLYSLTSLNISLKVVILGSLVTATLDQIAFWIDDNLLVPIGTAVAFWTLIG